jgi:formiminoglutamase
MKSVGLPQDPLWPRANILFDGSAAAADFALLGIPAHQTSISATSAHLTPAAVRELISRYSTYSGSKNIDLQQLSMADLGDIESPDGIDGQLRVSQFVNGLLSKHKLLVGLGGDNSISYSLCAGLWPDLSNIGIITFDAHHDLRDGDTNGSPIWKLIQKGVPGKNIVQIGLSDFANSRAYTDRAKEAGITIIYRSELRGRNISDVVKGALDIAGAGGREIFVDIDVDVCDRSVAPACPASVPGGITADEIRCAAFEVAADHRVRAIDITEIDAAMDAPDQRTLRLAALLVLEIATGLASRS